MVLGRFTRTHARDRGDSSTRCERPQQSRDNRWPGVDDAPRRNCRSLIFPLAHPRTANGWKRGRPNGLRNAQPLEEGEMDWIAALVLLVFLVSTSFARRI
jgi:hypothetical protein